MIERLYIHMEDGRFINGTIGVKCSQCGERLAVVSINQDARNHDYDAIIKPHKCLPRRPDPPKRSGSRAMNLLLSMSDVRAVTPKGKFNSVMLYAEREATARRCSISEVLDEEYIEISMNCYNAERYKIK